MGACGVSGNVEVAGRAAEKLAGSEPDGVVWRAALSSVCASVGRWEEAGRMDGAQLRGTFRFVVGDTRHPETERIYGAWKSIIKEHAWLGCCLLLEMCVWTSCMVKSFSTSVRI